MKFHDLVRQKFRLRGRHDCVPYAPVKCRRDLLAEFFADLGFERGVEIGVRIGTYSRILCEKNPNLHLYCIDPWIAYRGINQEKQDAFYSQAIENLKHYNITIIRKASMDAVSDFEDKSLDFAYIDGNHTFDYCCPDIIYWSQKVRKGGVMAVHDYCHFYWAGVVQAVDAYTRSHHIDPWYVTRERQPTAYWENP